MIIKVLIVVTSHGLLGTTGKPTGYYLPEVTHPMSVLEKAGVQVDIVSPLGGKAPLDERSRDLNDATNKEYLEKKDFVKKIENTKKPSEIKASDYAAIIYAGGHGTMWDFAENKELAKIASQIYERGGVVAAVCHGPAALLNIKLANGEYLIKNKRVAAFSNAEEEAAGLTKTMPYLLETELVKKGAKYSKADLWQKHVLVDERLVTGQNPASAHEVGEAVLKLLSSGNTVGL